MNRQFPKRAIGWLEGVCKVFITTYDQGNVSQNTSNMASHISENGTHQ